MLHKFIKLLLLVICVSLLSACSGLTVIELTISTIGQAPNDLSHERSPTISLTIGADYAFMDTFDKVFVTGLGSNYSNYSNGSNSSNFFQNFQKNVNTSDAKCSQVNFSFNGMSSFGIIFKEPISTKEIDIVKFDKPQHIDNDIPIIIYSYKASRMNIKKNLGFYSLNDALNYQWCKRTNDFNNGRYSGDYKKIDNTNLMYNINMTLSSDLTSCTVLFKERHCVILNYQYNINVVDTKNNKVYLSKKYEYTYKTSDLIGDVAYNPLNYYVATIVRKNREVIEQQILTDELYNTLTNASQNITTH